MKVNARVKPEDIDKLLNSFLDGELPVKQLAEVQRLLNGNKKLAQRLDQLRRCRALLAAVPYAKAPAGIVESVKASLAANAALTVKAPPVDNTKGVKELLLRRVLTAAAMFVLVAVLAGVIYTIVSPQSSPTGNSKYGMAPARDIRISVPVETGAPKAQIRGKLELTSTSFVEAETSMNTAIKDTNLDDFVIIDTLPRQTLYTFTCSRAQLNTLLTRIASDWPTFGSATFVLQADDPADRVAVAGVTLKQVTDIFAQNSLDKCARAAKYYAVANGASDNPEAPGEGTIPKPVLTGDSPSEGSESQLFPDDVTVSLTLVLTAQE